MVLWSFCKMGSFLDDILLKCGEENYTFPHNAVSCESDAGCGVLNLLLRRNEESGILLTNSFK
jgi:hypothetical protein